MFLQVLAEKSGAYRWWSQFLGHKHLLCNMPQSSVDIHKDDIMAAQQLPMCGIWVAGIVTQSAILGMPSPLSPFSSSGIVASNSLGVQANMEGQYGKV